MSGQKKTCKVTYWYMNPTSGISELKFIVPKGLVSRASYPLKVTNKIGTATASTNFEIDP